MRYQVGVLLMLLSLLCSNVFAYAALGPDAENHEQVCFAAAMIGYDNVINSRVGVPFSSALSVVSVNVESPIIEDTYKFELHKIVAGAYVWEHSPHEYAVKTLFQCAANQTGTNQSASIHKAMDVN